MKIKDSLIYRNIKLISSVSEEIFDGYTVTFEDDSVDYYEQRFVSFGMFQERIVAVVHTEKNENIRIISIRKATKHEERYYYATITN